jgi:hypothetical protein
MPSNSAAGDLASPAGNHLVLMPPGTVPARVRASLRLVLHVAVAMTPGMSPTSVTSSPFSIVSDRHQCELRPLQRVRISKLYDRQRSLSQDLPGEPCYAPRFIVNRRCCSQSSAVSDY